MNQPNTAGLGFLDRKRQRATDKETQANLISGNKKLSMPVNKWIAHCGFCSRREAATWVKNGKVKVNGVLVTDPGTKVTTKDSIEVNGKKTALATEKIYILMNKPKDCITTLDDPKDRNTVLNLIKDDLQERVFPVGRLDRNTTGVLLLTNDGELTQQLTHPSFMVQKIYEIVLDKALTREHAQSVLEGITLEDGVAKIDELSYLDSTNHKIIGVEIHSGKNRILRRIFEHLGYDIQSLDRVSFAGLTKKNVQRGKWRFLNDMEVKNIKYFQQPFLKKNEK